MTWETVIGLEVHVQLATASKLFCACPTTFGAPPNTHVCPVCLGLPGALPVPNERAVALATRAAVALGATVQRTSVFARKNYFYPDLPKGYQISQFDRPLATGGAVTIESPDGGPIAIELTRLHLEEDAGKLLHDRFPDLTAIDLNRAGVPLAEIVSTPTISSPAQARAYLNQLRQILIYAEVSDCNMEQGSLRVDANISLRPAGSERLGTKTEVKNLNSFANVERALEAERARQREILDAGGEVEQVTLVFDAVAGSVRPMRSKEDSHDYRYFPDPDLPPLVIETSWIDAQRAALPELPGAKRSRFERSYDLPAYDAAVLSQERAVADYFEEVVAAGVEPKPAANWVMGDVLAGYKNSGAFLVTAPRLAELISLVERGQLSHLAAKTVYESLGDDPRPPRAVAEALGLIQVRDPDELGRWVEQVISASGPEVERFRAGEVKLLGYFVGQVMKASRGKADPKMVAALLSERLG